MPKSESSRCELVGDARVQVEVDVGVARLFGQHLFLFHPPAAKNAGQPLVVDDVLVLCNNDPPGFLEHFLVVPAGVEVCQFVRYSIVFSHPNSVHHQQVKVLIDPEVTCESVIS